jgi:hypothetical protein
MSTSIIKYLTTNTKAPGETSKDWMAGWNALTDDDKADLRSWAASEMALLGVA